MDKAESTVRIMLQAVEAPRYDVGVRSDRGMLPGLESIEAAEVVSRLSLLKYRNARGSHIYIRPSAEHWFTVLDDLSESAVTQLSLDGFHSCAVVETSAGNFQVWFKHSAVLPKSIGTLAAQSLAARYDADPSAADWQRFGRLPGFTTASPNTVKPMACSPLYSSEVTLASSTPLAESFVNEITELHHKREQEREARRLQVSHSPPLRRAEYGLRSLLRPF